MDVQKKLDEIVAAVEGARSMPMSASCVINRGELLAMLQEVRDALPDSLSQAEALLGDREQMVAEARAEAEHIIAAAHEQRGSLIAQTEVARVSQEEADRILAEARREAAEIRAEADDYVDSKLANFEVVLTKTIGSVDRGREKLLGRDPGAGGMADPEYDEAPERSADPAELRRRADAYVDAKLGAFENALAKTLEAVGRGRQKLTGHRPVDELAAHLAAQDGVAAAVHQSDAEYLAGLAGKAPLAEEAAEPVPAPQPIHQGEQGYGYPQQSDYAPAAHYDGGYQDPYQQPQSGYDAYGNPLPAYPQHEEYAAGYGGWQGHGYEQQPQIAQQPHIPHQPQHHQQYPGAAPGLDETSFFDTGLINLDQLRELEQGR